MATTLNGSLNNRENMTNCFPGSLNNRQGFSSAGGSAPPEDKPKKLPNYLRASTGSCHDFCKYGGHHENRRKPLQKIWPKSSQNVTKSADMAIPGKRKMQNAVEHNKPESSGFKTTSDGGANRKGQRCSNAKTGRTRKTSVSSGKRLISSPHRTIGASNHDDCNGTLDTVRTGTEIVDAAVNATSSSSSSPLSSTNDTKDRFSSPRRLRFRTSRIIEAASGKNADDECLKINLKHQTVQRKKEREGLLNNVIEETANKLVLSEKSKVKALVGAFEAVISLQEENPRAH
ncbi:uncharacterized protein LOC127242327 isoform X1 [Andrographis paniculata]|uniref:uncharacterized protein LOC127242327 isoform X1 n=1 Tax=Andrographis paniculata TaxID=175694 RepID=UPI0021E8C55B|nr:uncharacterized protein LOC127242327 isoform X1 [Andrographis paniculata]XP_051117779.1 uncharacterized protein LOC127242327 isoform X1 [Andrographis paniculata]XP_051117780.1 uncharacterized protein LOC127242327 isoform X1 [Andrographis paniculata]XP_051117781.1 uncharacterized protein LOC127242327 isoform X1 [Andrographis paniculata]XP_051117782.1 uncharacterized protein LOC127242327 isoform X1 [Andrographis paniculata]